MTISDRWPLLSGQNLDPLGRPVAFPIFKQHMTKVLGGPWKGEHEDVARRCQVAGMLLDLPGAVGLRPRYGRARDDCGTVHRTME